MMTKFMATILVTMFALQSFAFALAPDQIKTAEAIYQNSYIQLMRGRDPQAVVATMLRVSRENKLTIKDVLTAAVAKDWILAEQSVRLEETAKKLAADPRLQAKVKANALSKADIQSLMTAFQSQMTGAECGHCGGGSYSSDYYFQVGITLVGLALLVTLVVAVVG